MKQQRVVALLSSAYVLWALASASAASTRFDAGSMAMALVALGCALIPVFRGAGDEGEGKPLTSMVSSALSLLLAAELLGSVHPLLSELTFALVTPLLGALVLRLSLRVPDVPVKLVRHAHSELPFRALGLLCLVLGVIAALPPVWVFDRALIAPHRFAYAPPAFALGCLVIATLLRLFRRRLGSDARALSANLWATLGSVLGLLLLASVLGARGFFQSARGAEHAILAIAAALFALGHAWLVSPRRVVVASQWTRELLSLGLGLAVSASAYLAAEPLWARDPLSRVVLCALLVALFAGSHAMAQRLTRWALAPHRGRLLTALDQARGEAISADRYEELAARILKPLRRSARSPEAAPLLYCFHPVREVRLDAAGQPHTHERELSPSIVQRLTQSLGEPVVRDDLAARLVRRPELRELVTALDELDALCVVPLVAQGQLEGALVVARGERRDPLTLEELTALSNFAAFVESLAAVFLMAERANHRYGLAAQERSELKSRVEELEEERDQLRADSATLRAGAVALTPRPDVVAYSPAMRALVSRLERVAGDDVTVLLVAEPGSEITSLARMVHETSGRHEAPFIEAQCKDFPADDALSALVGSRKGPGLFELAGQGTLVLYDVPALSSDAQRALAEALSERRARRLQGGASYPLEARIVVSARAGLAPLVLSGAIVAELARWLEPAACDVPPLRERREDVESLVLKALDRSARLSGRHVLGVAPDALRVLVEHDWPGNHAELELVVERAARLTTGTRIMLEDLPQLTSSGLASGSLADQERDILRRALEKAGGSRTRAARALGLKRTTLIDKLRRLGLEDPQGTNH